MDTIPSRKIRATRPLPNTSEATNKTISISSLLAVAIVAFVTILLPNHHRRYHKQQRPLSNNDRSHSRFVSGLQAPFLRSHKTTPSLSSKMNVNDHEDSATHGRHHKQSHELDLSRFTREEKLSWLGGYDLWNLRAIPGLSNTTDTDTTTTASSSSSSSGRFRWFSSSASSNASTSLCLSDGPHGLRKPLNDWTLQESHVSTCFPSACSTACSWNPELLETMGRALAKECQHYGVQVLLGPGVNLKRHPRGGRNHEYFSEDPYLAGILAKHYVSGVQESGRVGACLKHFCLNNQESNRFVTNVVVDERTMRELYLPAFEHSLRSSSVPKLVMGAYNKVNGRYCCEHEYLLGSILRGEWKYDGVVVSDWGAILDRSSSIKAGTDIEMPGTPARGAFDKEVLEDCESEQSRLLQREISNDEEQPMMGNRSTSVGSSSSELDSAIDACANRVVRLIADLQPGNPELHTDNQDGAAKQLFDANNRLAREIARECIVLLQNKDGFLPLSRGTVFRSGGNPKIGIVGAFARDSPRYQGMGSAHVTATKVTSLCDAIELLRGSDAATSPTNLSLPFAQGYDPDADGDEVQQSFIDEAVAIAQQQQALDVLVVSVGLPEIAESEGFDRTHSRLPQQHISLVEALMEAHPNVVVVLSNGGIVEIPESFVEGAKAILDGFLSGQAGGSALADVLFGEVSPSGRLPETIPIVPDRDASSANYFPGTRETIEYREGLDVGYRYYDTAGIPVRFPFGHGLHYTNFDYSNLSVAIERDEETIKRVRVSVEISNSGSGLSFSKPTMEVVQVYVRPIVSSVYRPHQELKGFTKIEIAPGATETVEIVLDERSFSYYDIGWKDWVVEESGSFEVRVGASSRDIRLAETLRFSTGRKASELSRESYPPLEANDQKEHESGPLLVGDEVFAKRFGQTSTSTTRSTVSGESSDISNNDNSNDNHALALVTSAITRNTLIADAAKVSRIAGFLMFVSWMAAKQEVKEGPTKKRELRMIRGNLENIPLRSLVVFSQGNLTFKMLDVLIHLMNGEYRKALWRIFGRR